MDTRKLLIYSSTSILLHTILWLLLNKLDQPTKDLPREPLEWIEFPKTDHQNIEDKTSNTQNEHQQKETKNVSFMNIIVFYFQFLNIELVRCV